MKTGILIAVILLVIAGATIGWQKKDAKIKHQQQNSGEAKDLEQRDAEDKKLQQRRDLEILAGYARNAPAEIAADALISIAQSNKVTDQVWKRELLAEAFRTAAGAQHKVKRKSLPGSIVDTRSGYLSSAMLSNLDALSLQCRAVKAMLSVDKTKARELFTEIPKLKLEPLSCEDPLVYDVSGFYETLTSVAKTAFTPKEIKQGEQTQFVKQYVEIQMSPAQVEIVAETILSLELPATQFEILVGAFSSALEKVAGDYRSFSVPWLSTIPTMHKLTEACKRREIANDKLLEAFRAYLIKQFSADRCSDSSTASERKTAEAEQINYFNNNLRLAVYPDNKRILPLSTDEIKPAKNEGAAKYYPYWQSSKAKKLLSRVQRLNFNDEGKKFTEAEKQGSEWQWRLSQFLADMTSWNPEDEKSEEDYFHQKNILLRGLLELVPAGPMHDDALNRLITFLSDSKLQQSDPIEWYWHAKRLTAKSRSAEGDGRLKIIEALGHSRSPILYLYTEIEKLKDQP